MGCTRSSMPCTDLLEAEQRELPPHEWVAVVEHVGLAKRLLGRGGLAEGIARAAGAQPRGAAGALAARVQEELLRMHMAMHT